MKFDYDAEYRKITYDTKEDYAIAHNFIRMLNPIYREIEKQMGQWLPNLRVQISPEGVISLWANTRRREAIKTPQVYNVGQLLVHQVKFLLWVNRELDKVVAEPDNYFWCTECGRVHLIDDYKASVFAGYWCKDCYDKNEAIQEQVRQSNEPGFYD